MQAWNIKKVNIHMFSIGIFTKIKKNIDSGLPVVKTALPLQGAQVEFLVGELSSRMPCCMAKRINK